jgi:MscS family membrane protein
MDYIYKLLPFLEEKTLDTIFIAFFIVLFLYLYNYILKEKIRRNVKVLLFSQRQLPLVRLIFNRYDNLLKPVRVLINILFYKLLANLFIQNKIVDDIFSLIYSFIIIWLFYEVIKLFLHSILIKKIKKNKNARIELFNLFLNISKVIIFFIVIVIILAKIGVDITALVTSLGIGGAILALSAKDTLTNFFDSLRLISSDAFRQGDWIQTNDVDGFVTEIGLLTTKIRTFSNAFVTLPNSKLANNYIKNWSKRMVGRKIKFDIRLKIENNSDEINKVIKEIQNMLNLHNDIVNDEKIDNLIKIRHTYSDGLFNVEDKYGVRKTMLVYLDKIDVYSMDIMVYAFSISVDWSKWLQTKQDVLQNILKIIDNSSLEFAYPKEDILIEHKS